VVLVAGVWWQTELAISKYSRLSSRNGEALWQAMSAETLKMLSMARMAVSTRGAFAGGGEA